jgi:Uma2 family endonuclease
MPSDARAGSGLPAIDERLVAPETPYEIHDGELVRVAPADPPHAERHLQLCALIEAHTGAGFEAACDLLTRASQIDDIAPDISIYPEGPDPTTGGRQLEQLAFEVVSTQTLTVAGRKAAKLVARGVRRVFAVDVERSRALEWSTVLEAWSLLDAAGHIADPALEVPLPIATLIHRVKADDAVARALVARRNPVFEAIRAEDRAEGHVEGKAEGRVEGKAEAVIALLEARGISLDQRARDRILGERDPRRLDRWITRAIVCTSVAALLAEP